MVAKAYIMTANENSKLNNSLEELRQAMIQRQSTQMIQLPLWSETKRGTPNSFIRSALFAAIQSKDRVFLKEVTLASQKGITVKYTGEQLNQEDLSVWETLAHIAKEHPLGHICDFSAHSLLKQLGLHTGGTQHTVLHSTIVRLTACAVEIKHEGQTFGGSLVEAWLKDDVSKHYKIRLNRELIKLFGENQWTALDWQQREKLRGKSLAQALHAFYRGAVEEPPKVFVLS
jgi:TrfA protein